MILPVGKKLIEYIIRHASDNFFAQCRFGLLEGLVGAKFKAAADIKILSFVCPLIIQYNMNTYGQAVGGNLLIGNCRGAEDILIDIATDLPIDIDHRCFA